MPDEKQPAADEQLPQYIIEGARSGRSRCKTCRRKIAMGGLRIGVLIEGPFGTGYLWHHLKCLARNRLHEVEEAYAQEAWDNAKTRPKGLPKIETLRALEDKKKKEKAERKELPHVEIAPSGRSKCKQCGESIAEGSARVVLGREVTFGQQIRTTPVKVHPGCVSGELERDDAAIKFADLEQGLRANSRGVDAARIDEVWAEISEKV